MSSAHAVPFYCPYCGEEDLVPDVSGAGGPGAGAGHGQWACRSCLRAFRLSLAALAVAPRPSTTAAPATRPASPGQQHHLDH